ncbi:DUF881 domain-containing protein [Sedimentibacter sp. zth1]|uniref:DUF881 domain-containing protein n=1 Tax=Sedimentibacter sp. zth1 TaxID=2816908 RepID=UPI001A920CFF|nr:DUF881 domain-containing protein [Sedimentibacter sp. zth1]QSX06154.1 DUF881 domain-containing protein [Sedimentibacter sp. zth1]
MKNKKINIFIFFLSLILAFLGIIQFTSASVILENNNYSDKNIATLKMQLDKLENDRKELIATVSSLNQQVDSFNETNEKIKENNDKLQEELNKYKIMSGGFDVKGEGIVITIQDPSEENTELFQNYTIANHYYLILSLISNLNSAGAEAISINDQRYTSYTEIVPVSNFLNINGKHIVAPIEVKVIGDKRTLESAINFIGGVVDQMKSLGFQIDIEHNNEIIIHGLTKLKTFKYLEPFEDEFE